LQRKLYKSTALYIIAAIILVLFFYAWGLMFIRHQQHPDIEFDTSAGQ